MKGRIKFYRPDGTQGDSPGCGSVLIAFGEENAKILEYSNIPGKYIKLNNEDGKEKSNIDLMQVFPRNS